MALEIWPKIGLSGKIRFIASYSKYIIGEKNGNILRLIRPGLMNDLKAELNFGQFSHPTRAA